MIASQYGWTDEQILDVSVRRLRQMVAVIFARRESEEDLKQAYLEWQTRVLATFIAGTAQSGKAVKALMDRVSTISIRPDKTKPEKELPSTEGVLAQFGARLEPPRGE